MSVTQVHGVPLAMCNTVFTSGMQESTVDDQLTGQSSNPCTVLLETVEDQEYTLWIRTSH